MEFRGGYTMITGSAGFLGKAIVNEMNERFRKARKRGDKAYLKQVWRSRHRPFDVPEHTIISPDPWNPTAGSIFRDKNGKPDPIADMDDGIRDSALVIHCAAIADLNQSAKDWVKNWRVNLEGTWNIARLCWKHKKPLMYISTCCAYGATGNIDKVLTERSITRPTELYARSKVAGEWAIRLLGLVGLKWQIARVATFYGPGMRKALFNYIAVDRVARGEEIEVHGDGHQTRTYCYIGDIVSGILHAVEHAPWNNIYNVAGWEHTSVLDTIKTAERIIGKEARFRHVRDRRGQIKHEAVSSDKLRATGWVPVVDYETGMKRTYEWWRKVHGN